MRTNIVFLVVAWLFACNTAFAELNYGWNSAPPPTATNGQSFTISAWAQESEGGDVTLQIRRNGQMIASATREPGLTSGTDSRVEHLAAVGPTSAKPLPCALGTT